MILRGGGVGAASDATPSESALVFPHIDLAQIVEILPHVRHVLPEWTAGSTKQKL